MPKSGSVQCERASPCYTQVQLRDYIISLDDGFRKGDASDGATQAADGFDPNEACPTTELFNSGIDILLVANQVCVHGRLLRYPNGRPHNGVS
jgi:hypothetical protein